MTHNACLKPADFDWIFKTIVCRKAIVEVLAEVHHSVLNVPLYMRSH